VYVFDVRSLDDKEAAKSMDICLAGNDMKRYYREKDVITDTLKAIDEF